MTEMMKLNGKGALGVSVDLGEGDITEGEDGFANISQVRDDNCRVKSNFYIFLWEIHIKYVGGSFPGPDICYVIFFLFCPILAKIRFEF